MAKIRSHFLIVISLFILFTGTINAAENSSPSALQKQSVNYFLPYPGILPDNPFHFLKAARDRIVSLLINDDLKRAEFNLLTSDKRMYAGYMLVERGKMEQGFVTISKSNNYFHQAISAAGDLKDSSEYDLDGLYGRLSLSVAKHIELMRDLNSTIPKEQEDVYENELGRMEEFQKVVDKKMIDLKE